MTALAIGVVVIILMAVVSQAARESLLLLSGYLGRRIIRRAAKALPDKRRLTRESEWLAEWQRLLDKGLAFGSLMFAIGCPISAHRIRHEVSKKVQVDATERSPLTGAARNFVRSFILYAVDDAVAVAGALWVAALAYLLPVLAGGILNGHLTLFGILTLALGSVHTLAGFGLLARRSQLKRRKGRLDRPTGSV